LRRDATAIRRALLSWAREHDRPLPWRGVRDPYRVLVSEVMLQQTQAGRIVEAYPAFLDRFPTVEALSQADPADVLRAWGNLGYNRRAVNLWRAANAIVERGAFPDTVEELEALPGVGPYTARAVASFAFGRDTAVVEANVRRIVSRLEPDADVAVLADGLVPRGRAAAWNQALMDLGADVCRPRNPCCGVCPLAAFCAWSRGVRRDAPARAAAPPFETTNRYARGRVVAALRERRRAVTVTALRRVTRLTEERLHAAVRGLERDGIVTVGSGRVALGQRARERRLATSDTT
jgi:A/G-specific adenine glycosylase